jgi:hypothetical protein
MLLVIRFALLFPNRIAPEFLHADGTVLVQMVKEPGIAVANLDTKV